MSSHDVVITGIGLVSSLGEGADVHWKAMSTPGTQAKVDATRFPPYVIHPLPEIDWGRQIPKRGDQRQMETWQRLGTYTAGLALDDAGIKGDEPLCAAMDMVIAAGGGERDASVDADILEASTSRIDREVLLNEKLTTELRPTLFLAQLSNLLAGNISIVHKVTGSSRTFMGEEGAGVAAVETAVARIASGQSSHILVGGAFQTEHPDMLLGYELGGYLHRGAQVPVWSRAGSAGGGVISGSGSAFLVLESREHADARGQKIYATLSDVVSGRANRRRESLGDAILAAVSSHTRAGPTMVVSGASGAHAATQAERTAFDRNTDLAPRAFSTLTGHLREAQFLFAIGLAALSVQHGEAYPTLDPATEKPFEGDMGSALATTVGYHYFEGAALIRRAN